MSEANLLNNVVGDLASLPPTANPFDFLRARIIDVATANLRTHAYVRPVLFVVSALYALLSIAIIAALVVRVRRKTFWAFRKEAVPLGTIYCPNGSTLFACFFLAFYLVGQIYCHIFLWSVYQAVDHNNLGPYIMAPVVLIAFLPLYCGAWCDMASLAASAFVTRCRDRDSKLSRLPPWLIHTLILSPPLITCSYVIVFFAFLGVHLRDEAAAWRIVDAGLAVDAAQWVPGTPLIESIGVLAALEAPANALSDRFAESVQWLRVVLGSLAANLLILCICWLPVATMGLVQVIKQLRMLKANRASSFGPPAVKRQSEKRWSFGVPRRDAVDSLERRSRILVRLCWIRSAGVIGFIVICVYTVYFGFSYAIDPALVDRSPSEFVGWLLGFHGVQLLTTGPANIVFVVRSFQEGRELRPTSAVLVDLPAASPGVEEKEVDGRPMVPVLGRGSVRSRV